MRADIHRSNRWRTILGLAALTTASVLTTSCDKSDIDEPIGSARIPANLIMASGHGRYFDRDGNAIELDDRLRADILASMIDVLWPLAVGTIPAKRVAALDAGRQLLRSANLTPADALLLGTGMVGNLLNDSPAEYRHFYERRFRLLLPRGYSLYLDLQDGQGRIDDDDSELLILLLDLGIEDFLDLLDDLIEPTDYIARCRQAGVPVPEYWSAEIESGWKLQGELTQNLLEPGNPAFVWTWADNESEFGEAVFGGCIALPRNDGSFGTAAGIICQGAVSGNACFWDDKLKSDPMQAFIGWRDKRLYLRDLHDGDSLNEDCTRCHRGDNVFIVAPDDPTWQNTINRSRSFNTGRAFVTNHILELYTPISRQSDPAANTWVNAPTQRDGVCSAACHSFAPDSDLEQQPAMPPACSLLPGTGAPDPTWCYRGP